MGKKLLTLIATAIIAVAIVALPTGMASAAPLPAGTLIESVSISPEHPTYGEAVTLTAITNGGEQTCEFYDWLVSGDGAGGGSITTTNSDTNTWTATHTMPSGGGTLISYTLLVICSDASDDTEDQTVATFVDADLREPTPGGGTQGGGTQGGGTTTPGRTDATRNPRTGDVNVAFIVLTSVIAVASITIAGLGIKKASAKQ